MFQDEHADNEPHRFAWPAVVGKIGRDLLIQPDPIDLVGKDDEFVLQVDDLIESGLKQVVVIGFFQLFRSHQNPQKQCLERITNGPISESKSQGNDRKTGTFLQ